jgi:hypothetical protein
VAVARKRLDETREMRLFTKVIELSPAASETSLPQFLAARRVPEDPRWRTWDQITIDLYHITGEVVTDVSLLRWASRYGIPEGTQPSGSPITKVEFAQALKEHSIKI